MGKETDYKYATDEVKMRFITYCLKVVFEEGLNFLSEVIRTTQLI